jgi:hypothetical protein
MPTKSDLSSQQGQDIIFSVVFTPLRPPATTAVFAPYTCHLSTLNKHCIARCGLAFPYDCRDFFGPNKKTSVGLLIFNLLCFLLSYSDFELQLIDGLQEHGVLTHDGEVYQDVIIAQEEGEGGNNTQDMLVF